MSNFGQQYVNTNPYIPTDSSAMYQQRLNNMAQQVMGQGQPNGFNMGMFQSGQVGNMMGQMQQIPGQSFNVRVVTGYEEAMASQTPLDGSISILLDRTHEMIYTKQLNMNDGTPLVKRYKLSETPKSAEAPVENSVEYVEKKEFDDLKERFEQLWGALTDNKTESNAKKEVDK